MLHVILPKQSSKDSIAKVAPFITKNTSRSAKPGKDISIDELHHCFSVLFLRSNRLYPL